MIQKQQYFVNNHTRRLETTNILALDRPIPKPGSDLIVTLRRHLMMKAPETSITGRVFVSVDPAWRGSDFVATVPKAHMAQAHRILNNLIPECMHMYGAAAQQWFTTSGLLAFQDVKSDPVANRSITARAVISGMVSEDFFGMGGEWREPEPERPTTEPAPKVIPQGQSVIEPADIQQILEERTNGVRDDTTSFGDQFGRSHSGSTVAEEHA
jgi:hypothetical protein